MLAGRMAALPRAAQSLPCSARAVGLLPHRGHGLWRGPGWHNDPFRVVEQMLAAVNHEFRLWASDPHQRAGEGGPAGGQWAWCPTADVSEAHDAVTVRCDLPGLKKEDIQVELQQGRLLVSGQREETTAQETEKWACNERSFGSFVRSFAVPAGATQEDIAATYKDGVLEVTIRKRPEQIATPSRIQIG